MRIHASLTFAVVMMGLLTSTICGWGQDDRKKHPHVVSDPPLSPQEQLKRFHLPPGFTIQLVAAEPEVRKPMNLNFDAAGRLWFTQSVEYPFPLDKEGVGRDTVRVIEGINPDGSATKVTTFGDGLNIPIGVTPVKGGAIVFSIPKIYRLTDGDGDGKADERNVLFGDFGFRDTHGLNNSFTRWIDGWIYACHGYINSSHVSGTDGQKAEIEGGNVYRFRPDGSHIEHFTHGQVNPFGLAFDPLGNLFSADCHTQPAYMLLRGGYYPSFGKPHDGLGFAPKIMSHSHGSTGIAGIAYYAAEQFPKEYRDNLYIGNPITHRVNRDKLVAHGSSFEAVEQPDFLSCDDPWFRPVEVKLGPDGALYIGDFYNCIIGHYEVPLNHPKRDRERGRIWRIVYTGVEGEKAPEAKAPNLTKENADQLVARLNDPNLIVRTLATHHLVDNWHGTAAITPLKKLLAARETPANQVVHGMWVLERFNSLDDALLSQLLENPDRTVRTHALKLLAERNAWSGSSVAWSDLVRQRLRDEDAFVRRAAAEALANHPEAANVTPLLELWSATPADDAQLIHMVRMSLRDQLTVPDIMDRVAGKDNDLGVTADQRGQLAELCLGIPNTPAAELALDYLKSHPEKATKMGDSIYQLLRYVSEGRIQDVYDLALVCRDQQPRRGSSMKRDELGHNKTILLGLQRAAQERGLTLPEPIVSWAKDLALSLLNEKRGSSREIGIELAWQMKIADAHPKLRQIALRDAGSDLRMDAMLACVAINGPESVDLLDNVLKKFDEELGLRQRAARSLGVVNTDAAREKLLAYLPQAPERLAVEIAAALATSKVGADALLAAIESGKASALLLQEPIILDRLKQQKLDSLEERIATLTAGLPSRDDQIRILIEDRIMGFHKGKPDAERGKLVFNKVCATCHKINGEGNKVGPELDGIGVRGLERLMEDVLDPSRNVDQAFRRTSLTTSEDGFQLSGLVVREDDNVVVLVDQDGKERTVPKNDIEPDSRQVSPLSPMPANVRDLTTEAEFYDLLAFLLEQQPSDKEKKPAGK